MTKTYPEGTIFPSTVRLEPDTTQFTTLMMHLQSSASEEAKRIKDEWMADILHPLEELNEQ